MFVRRFRLLVVLLAAFVCVCRGQSGPSPAQTARQAILEMFSGGEAPFKRHLTTEMQNKLEAMAKDSPSGASPLQMLALLKTTDPDSFQAFDLGPILFSFNNPSQHERYEVEIDNEEPGGDEDLMGLSVHLLRNGVEQEMPAQIHFVLNMKKQQGLWRLDTLTMNATLPLNDPRILSKSWWGPAFFSAFSNDTPDPKPLVVTDERPRLSPLRAVRMIDIAENIYAQNHPGIGFTCTMADLVNVGKGLDEDGVYKFMDAEFAGGIYNGYRFTLSGCERKPARTFRITAEPLAGKGRAYCSDYTSNLRASDDGRGVTCLVAGKTTRK
ncbi:MAG TPA: hypothetical protein VJW20_05310 [Candidatus Angelobacter sp.]|nr:hypothetical protein [Candidatus Angelobacter sp.]